MLKLNGYQILTAIYESANSLVYRGIRQQDNQPVILKVLREDYPTPQELTRYKQEYEITRNLNLDGVVKAYAIVPDQRTLVIIFEDFGASSLKQLLNQEVGHVVQLPQLLSIAIKIADSLRHIHAANIIHKDINPANIVFNPETGQVKIIDFGISTQLTREHPTLKTPDVLEGTLAYMSPEQTGRMNRTLDYRTDFYSLGVTFYELLTGQLPFSTDDALELVHCHIAKVPISPHQVNSEIPLAVSDIVMKLMAKTAEERYQSAWGIKADLEECLNQLQATGKIEPFLLGTLDISDKFQIPQKLYGREAEVETLLAAFERVASSVGVSLADRQVASNSNNPQSKIEMMLVAGYSGIGKSSLVAEIHKPNTQLRGYFTSGKFDQFQRNIPYSAIVSAFKGLMRQLLTESDAQLNLWRGKLLAAFGASGQVIIDVIPEVELIVGKQPPVSELGPTESQNRFNLVFSKFIQAFCTKEHPLVIFLDDLQWADSASLQLIELIMTDTQMQYLFLIGAYRDNEVSSTHPLIIMLDRLRNLGATINFITLASLELKHINQIIADTLCSDTDKSQPLAEPATQRPEKIFEIVDHLNLGRELMADEYELVELARLNLEAGKKAKDSMAYAAALSQYFIPGIEALPGDIWRNYYDLTFSLYRARSECEYLCRNFDKAEESFNLILSQVKSTFDRSAISNIRMILYENTSNYLEALRIGSETLKAFGLNLPVTDETEILSEFDLELQLYKANLKKIKIEELIHSSEMTNLQIKECMKLLTNMAASAYYTDQNLLALISLKIVNLAIEYGKSQESAYGYALWGIISGSKLISYDIGYEFGQLAIHLTEQFNNPNLTCKVFNSFGGLISPWRRHLKKSIPILREGYLAALETGDVYASTNSYNLILQRILAADSFSSIIEESQKHIDFLKQIKIYIFAEVQQLYQRFLVNLQGLTRDKFSLSDEEFDEVQYVQRWQESGFLTGVAPYNIFKTKIFFLYGDCEKALKWVRESQNTLAFVSGVPIQAEHYLDYSLILTALYPTASSSEQKEFWEILETNQKKMKIWADNCPENFLHKYLLVEAEIARIAGKEIEAIDLYDRAISSARENEYIQNEALSNELAAKFWLGKGKEEIAQLYMKKARYGYQLWGARRKVEDLEEKYPQLLLKSSATTGTTDIRTKTTSISTTNGSKEALDLATAIKASQAISGEIVLDKLLANLMKILIENAGAQVGYLILETEGQLFIAASGEVDIDNITVLQSIPIDNCLPSAIINYVARTKESVVLNDGTVEGKFTNDPYIKQHQTKSILCVPLINQGQLASIIYFENNLTVGAFTSDRLEVLKILSAQAAISIENARLYQTLEDKVKERTAQLAQANEEISTLNEKLKAENLRMSAELAVTKQLQQMILPKSEELESIEGLEIAGYMEPADEVGGDYYDILPQNGKVKIGIGDVTGHGLESGVLMLMTQTAVRTLQESQQTDPVKFLDILNRAIYRNVQRINPYKNMSLSVLDYADGTLSISGQHEEIIIVRSGGKVEQIDTQNLGFPIGLDEEIAEYIAQEQVQLNPGDVVVLYTDGITEAEDMNRVQYGLRRLCEVVSQNWERSAVEIKQAAIEDVRRHIGSQKVFDDITLVVLKQK